MTATVTPIVSSKKAPKVGFALAQPRDVIDVWRVYERWMKVTKPEYPVLDEENPEMIRAHLFQLLSAPSNLTMIAKQGRKVVGLVLAAAAVRPYGLPRTFADVGAVYAESAEIRGALLKAFFAECKGLQIHHWESWVGQAEAEEFTRDNLGKELARRVGGKIVIE